jgi:hypothetical protein
MLGILLAAVMASGPAGPAATPSIRQVPGAFAPLAVGIISQSASLVSFNLNDPDGAPVSSGGTVTWTVTGGRTAKGWNLYMSSGGATTLTNCTEVPISAVRVTCGTVSGGTTGTCDSGGTLTTTEVEIARGPEAANTYTTTVSLTYSITDAWKYKGHTTPACSLNVSYHISAN